MATTYNNSSDYKPTIYNIQTGGSLGTLNNVVPSTTSGIPVISQGSSSQPIFGTALVAGGGTGATTLTSNGVLIGNGTGVIAVTAAGTTGQVLTGVTSGAPTFQSPAASSITITGDSGGGLTGSSFTFTGASTGLTFAGSGTTETLGGTLIVGNGGTGAATFTSHGVLLGNTTSAITATAAGTTGQVLTGVTGSAPTFQSPAASSITITGNSGGGLTGSSFTFTGGTTGLTFAGSGTTETLGGTLIVGNGGTGAATLTGVLIGNGTSAVTGNAVTQYNVLVGGSSNAISSVAPSATSGVPLISGGSSANPSFGTAVVAGGGTGDTSFTAYAVIAGGTTSTGALQSIASVGTSGQVLTSNGAGALPTFQAASGGSSALTLITTKTAAAAASVTFTSGISSSFDNYVLVVSNGSIEASSSAPALQIQFSTNGGSSYLATSYANYGSTAINTTGIDFAYAQSAASTTVVMGNITLVNLTKATNIPAALGTCIFYNTAAGDTFSVGGVYAGGAISVNALRVVMSDASNFSGIFSLYSLSS